MALDAVALLWSSSPALVVTAVALRAAGAVVAAMVVVTAAGAVQALGRDASSARALLDALTATLVAVGGAAVLIGVGARTQSLLAIAVDRKTTMRMLDACARVDVSRFEDPEFHDRIERVKANALDKPVAVANALLDLVAGSVGIVAVAGGLLLVEPYLVPVLVLGMVPLVVVALAGGRREVDFARERASGDRRRAYLQQVLIDTAAAKELRVFGAAPAFLGMLGAEYDAHIRLLRRHTLRRLAFTLATQFTSAALMVAFLYFAVTLNRSGRLTVPEMAAAVAAVPLLLARIGNLTTGAATLFQSIGLFRELPALEAEARAVAGRPGTPTAMGDHRRGPPRIELRHVSFAYPYSERRAVDDVSFVIPAGKVVALVGENGSGKTTLVKLMAQLYRPHEGVVTWDGIDTASRPPVAWHGRMAVLFQDFGRYELAVAENVSLGRLAADDEADRLDGAMARAGIGRLVERLPSGADTVLSKAWPNGVELSGGEWQGVALARACFGAADLVVLDEPTAALDPRAEYELFRRIRRIFADQTVVLVSHRLNSVRMADCIFVMADGRLVEQGTHDELVAAGGLYAELFTLQQATAEPPH